MHPFSTHRSEIVRRLLSIAPKLLVDQGELGRDGCTCCNHTEDGTGCVVGLLVGPQKFMVGSTALANALSAEQYQSVLDSLSTHPNEFRFSSWCEADQNDFRWMLTSLQKMHDDMANSAHMSENWQSMDEAYTLVFAGLCGIMLLSFDHDLRFNEGLSNPPTVTCAGFRGVICGESGTLNGNMKKFLQAAWSFSCLK